MKTAGQKERILKVLEDLQLGNTGIAEEYLRRHKTGIGVSARYFKQVMLISECNGRISELRAKGHEIETSREKDHYGFSFHRLKPKKTAEEWFESLPN